MSITPPPKPSSAYPRDWDYKRFREIADSCGALLMCDMAHISGLVAAQEANSPFEYCDIVTSTTHKSLRGPRSGIIFFKKDERGLEAKINFAVFPMLQGGPHEHQIAALATQLKEVASPDFKAYIQQVVKNTRALAAALTGMGHVLATGGSDNHLILWDLRPHGVTGSKMEKVCDKAEITLNKNAILGDRSALAPGAVRIGTPALTTRGFKEEHFEQVAKFLDRALKIAIEVQNEVCADWNAGFLRCMCVVCVCMCMCECVCVLYVYYVSHQSLPCLPPSNRLESLSRRLSLDSRATRR